MGIEKRAVTSLNSDIYGGLCMQIFSKIIKINQFMKPSELLNSTKVGIISPMRYGKPSVRSNACKLIILYAP